MQYVHNFNAHNFSFWPSKPKIMYYEIYNSFDNNCFESIPNVLFKKVFYLRELIQ